MAKVKSTSMLFSLAVVLPILLFQPFAATVVIPPEEGDWIIREPTTVSGQTIIMNGNIKVYSILTLEKVELYMNCKENRQYKIYVAPEGEIILHDKTLITSYDGEHLYDFKVKGSIKMENSEISKAYILDVSENSRATIRESYLHDNIYALYLRGTSEAIITDNTFSSNQKAVLLSNADGNSLTGNLFKKNYIGLYLRNSHNNVISKSSFEGNTYGISINRDSSKNIFEKLEMNGNTKAILVKNSRNNSFNEISAVKNYIGLYFYSSYVNSIKNSFFGENTYGIYIYNKEGRIRELIDGELSAVEIKPVKEEILPKAGNIFEDVTLESNDKGAVVKKSVGNFFKNMKVKSNRIGIYFYYAVGNSVADSAFTENDYGIYFRKSKGNTLENISSEQNTKSILLIKSYFNKFVQITSAKDRIGIYLKDGSNLNTITKSSFNEDACSGIYINASSGNLITGNDIGGDGDKSIGVKLTKGSTRNIIQKNIIHHHRYGIYMDKESHKNIVKPNEFHDNEYDIYYEGGGEEKEIFRSK